MQTRVHTILATNIQSFADLINTIKMMIYEHKCKNSMPLLISPNASTSIKKKGIRNNSFLKFCYSIFWAVLKTLVAIFNKKIF